MSDTTEASAPPVEAVKPSPAEVRAWARDNGFTVGDRGRMSADVFSAYAEAKRARSAK